MSALVLVGGWFAGACQQRDVLGGSAGPPPVLTALPLDPVPATGRFDVEVAAQLLRSIQRLEEVQAELDPFLGVDADADARRVQRLGELAPALRELAARLQPQSEAVAATAEGGSAASRALARRLLLVSQRIDLLLAQWSRCAPSQLSPLLAALESLSLEVRSEAVHQTAPTAGISYSFFPGHPPGLVPRQDAWLVAVRPERWPQAELRVEIFARSRRDPVAISATTLAGQENALAVLLDRERLAEFVGDCLRLEIRADRDAGKGTSSEPRQDPLASWPLCLPYAAGTEYELAGYLEYRTPTRSRTLERKTILFANSSCDQEKSVAETLEWELHPSGTLVEIGGSDLFEANSNSIECEIDGNRVRCAGTLAPATCEASAEGPPRLVQQTAWEQFIAPTEEIPEEEQHSSQAVSESTSSGTGPGPFCVQLARDEPSVESEMRFELVAKNEQQRKVVFSSPVETLERELTTRYGMASRRIDARFEVDGEPGSSRICVELHAAEACGL